MAEAVRAVPSPPRLVLREIRHQNLLFWRNPLSAFFTLLFPLIFLVLFNSIQGGERLETRSGIAFAQFFTPSILVFAAVSACYTNLAITVAIHRDEGILKRLRGTPLPAWAYMAGRIGSAVWIAVLASVLMVAVGVIFFDVQIIGRLLPAALVTLLVGTASFCALGLAVASVTPNGEAAPAVANFTLLPITFVSDIFFPLDNAPGWLQTIGDIFPVKHFAAAMQTDFNPYTVDTGFEWTHLLVMAAWGAAGVVVAARTFQWEPRAGGGRRRRRGQGAT